MVNKKRKWVGHKPLLVLSDVMLKFGLRKPKVGLGHLKVSMTVFESDIDEIVAAMKKGGYVVKGMYRKLKYEANQEAKK